MSETADRKEKFTPGPWKLIEVDGRLVPSHDYCSILTVVHEDDSVFGAVYSKEDAALIAAAPDMYAALSELLDSDSVAIFSSAMESDSWKLDLKEWETRARSALSKARGES